MRYKTLALLMPLILLGALLLFESCDPPSNRYYQHRQAAEKPPCTDHGPEVFCSHLPVLSIVTDGPVPDPYMRGENGEILLKENGRLMHNSESVSASMQVFDRQEANNHLTDNPVFSTRMAFRVRGKSSRDFEKKSYLLKLKEDDMITKRELPLLGMTADSSWALHGPFMDRTLIRNYIMYNLAGEIMPYSPNVRFCEMFLNGEYMGVYLLVEKITYNPNGRVQLSRSRDIIDQTSYILKMDIGETDANHRISTFFDYSGRRGISTRGYENLEIVYPGRTLTPAQKGTIIREISSFEKVLDSYDFNDPKYGYSAYIDVESFVDYFVLNEFSMNRDAGILSTYFSCDLRGKITAIGWDYNNVFNNYFDDLTHPHTFYVNNSWYTMLLHDRHFVDLVVHRYHQLRRGILSDESLFQLIDETLAYLGPAIQRNNARWGYVFDVDYSALSEEESEALAVVRPYTNNPSSYEQAVSMLKENIAEHGAFLDENIESLYALCHDSATKSIKLQEEP